MRGLTDRAIRLLAEKQWPMLPSAGSSKGPCVMWGEFQRRLPGVDQLRNWDREFRPQRWGVVTGALAGIVVADFDGDYGCALMKEWGIDPHVRTGSGGYHWYGVHPGWRVPTLNARTSKRSWPWPGVDIRGDGGFAVLLGRNSKGPYTQLRDLVPEPFEKLPGELRTFLWNHGQKKTAPTSTAPPQQTTRVGGKRADRDCLITKALEIAAENGRNNAGFWLACQLRDNGYGIAEAEVAAREYRSRVAPTNTKGQIEPYTESELTASLSEAYSRPARSPWESKKTLPQEERESAVSERSTSHHSGEGFSGKEKTADRAIADDPQNLYLYVGHPCEPLVGHPCEPLSTTRFAKIPIAVSTDSRLTRRDVCVYGALAQAAWSGGECEVGKRRLSRLAPCAERLVIESLKRLEATGHIRKQSRKRGQRARYTLLSPVFAQKQSSAQTGRDMRNGPQPVSLPRKDPRTALVSESRPQAALEVRRSRRSTP
jgi:Bifunctional DNA primase/polymerase, N-terminal